jgi:pyruvate dehydrogenase E1 component alpha subunit
MNLAGVWKLPVIFLCENNQYAVTSSFKEMCASENIADRAQAYNFPGILVDGQDVMAVHEAVSHAAARARSGEGPSLIEARTYRFQEHSLGMERIIKVQYRTEEELEEWMRRDPIQMHAANLVAQGIATQAEIDQVDQEEKARIVEAAEFARQSPFPEPSAIFDDMFAVPIPLE